MSKYEGSIGVSAHPQFHINKDSQHIKISHRAGSQPLVRHKGNRIVICIQDRLIHTRQPAQRLFRTLLASARDLVTFRVFSE